MEFLNDLNETQRAAVMNLDGPLMVIAGAGSGKTRVLTYRLAFILSQGLADPQELLALTFTNKAAREMKKRIVGLIGNDAKGIQMGTFHSIFSRILRIEANRIGYTSSYTIYDSEDSLKQIKALLKEKKLDDKTYKPRLVRNSISSAKSRMIKPAELKEMAIDDFNLQVADLYAAYETRCFRANAMDFDDLLIKPIELFKSQPDILNKYQHRFKYIMVDEYQDTNHAQYLLTKMLAAVHENICVVGDDAQSIYAFRGADIQNILNFKIDYPNTEMVKLEQNYRSTKVIVQAANSIIAKNKDQIPKKVYTENENGEFITVLEAASEQDEAKRITSLIREQKHMLNLFNREFAILYRTNAQSRAMEDALRKSGLKYQVFGGLSFYQRKEIKDMVAYMRLAVNPRDEQALLRVINYPSRGIGKTTQERLVVYAAQLNCSLWEGMTQIAGSGLSNRVLKTIEPFVTMIRSFTAIAQDKNCHETAVYIAKQSGILAALDAEKPHDGPMRWDNVQELLNAAQEFVENSEEEDVSLERFLADIALFTDQDNEDDDDDKITLMTIHSAKGLEFNSVFLVGMEENLFPNAMSTDTRNELEEERRLMYVAVTRAQKYLTLSYAKSRYKFGNIQYNEPSRFIEDIDGKFLKMPQRVSLRKPVPGNSGVRRTAASRKLRPVSQLQNEPNFDAAAPADIVAGIQVYHAKFGTGKVKQVEGDGVNKKATIVFKQKGEKILLLKYAKLKII